MKERPLPLPRITGWFAGLMAVLLCCGCATTRVNWNSRIGTYTYDQAVLELGPPDKAAKLSDGTTVAEWLTRRGYSPAYFGAYYGGDYWHHPYYYPGPIYYSDFPTPDYFLRLTFDPDGKLRAWKKLAR